MKKFKIIVDSSCDLKNDYLKNDNIAFSVVPLSINIGDKVFSDNDNVNVEEVLKAMKDYEGKSTTSCPSPGEYLEAIEGAEAYFIITISSKLSGSHNAACTAKGMSECKNIHVIDSKLTSGAEVLVIDELVRLIESGQEYDEIVPLIDKFNSERNLFFTLCKYDNLVKAGRMSKIMSILASTLRIVPVCEGKDGEIHIREKTITQKSAYRKITDSMKNIFDPNIHKVCIISHCFNEEGAEYIKTLLEEKCAFKEIRIVPVKALCAFYALRGGVLVSF